MSKCSTRGFARLSLFAFLCMQILAIKQAAAIRARAAATTAAKRMHQWMTDLDGAYGWSRAVKKQRTV